MKMAVLLPVSQKLVEMQLFNDDSEKSVMMAILSTMTDVLRPVKTSSVEMDSYRYEKHVMTAIPSHEMAVMLCVR